MPLTDRVRLGRISFPLMTYLRELLRHTCLSELLAYHSLRAQLGAGGGVSYTFTGVGQIWQDYLVEKPFFNM